MKLPLTIDRTYSTELSKEEIMRVVYSGEKESSFSGLKIESYVGGMVGNQFEIKRQAVGISAFIAPYPVIQGWTFDNPTRVKLKIVPMYLNIVFFSIGFLSCTFGGGFASKIAEGTVNERISTISDRVGFIVFGLIMGVWGYLNSIRPIRTSEKWAMKKFKLTRIA